MNSSVLSALDFELASGELISEVNDLQLSRIDIQDSPNEYIFEL